MWSVGTGRAQEQVGRLDVAVDDPGPVDGDEGVEELAQELGGETRRQRSVVADEGGGTDPPWTTGIVEQDAVVLAGRRSGVRTCGWATRTACSRTKRSSDTASDWRSTLAATIRSHGSPRTRQTDPMPPSPMRSTSS